MHVYYKFGLFLIFLLTVSFCIPSSSASDTDKNDEYYDYDAYDDLDNNEESSDKDNVTTSSSPLPSSSLSPLPSSSSTEASITSRVSDDEEDELEENYNYDQIPIDLPKRSNTADTEQCPKQCDCTDELQLIKCSYMDLTQVPKNIPRTALKIDLSHNLIQAIDENDFRDCTKLREINLNENRINNISKETFANLTHLEVLSLANNRLTEIDPDVFSDAINLSKLDLSNNSIVLPKDQPFLNLPDLQELLLRNTSFKEIYDETFHNLSGLTLLKMDFNDFDRKINTKAFAPMKNLIKLKLPELEADNIKELCNVLKSIDNIGFKRFDISCFEFVLGTSFNESLIFATDEPSVKILPKAHENPTEKTTLDKPTPRNVLMNKTRATPKMAEASTASPLSETGAKLNQTLEKGLGDATTTEQTFQVSISPEAINYMLIAIIVLASIGVLIGIICRKDIGGIKTKCCRRRKPLPTDQVRPAEEIPLNKVV